MTRATKFIRASAKRFTDSGGSVDWDSDYSTVSIDCKGQDGIFMQGEEADCFIDEVSALCKRFPSLDDYTAACALAEPYTD